jgi:hypothetical protein
MKLFAIVGAAVLAMTVAAAAPRAQQTAPPKEAPAKQGAKPAAEPPSLVGKWKMTIEAPNGNGTTEATLILDVDGKKLTGKIMGLRGMQDVAGEVNKDKFKFSLSLALQGYPVDVDFDGKLKSDGTLSGTANYAGMVTVDWQATRIKDSDK